MLMLNPLWLRSFHALVEQGSFTRAADQLELTQAAVSQHVQKLEAELGALFIRRPRQLELTPAGHALVDYLGERAEVDQRLKLRLAGDRDDHGEISLMTPGSIGLALYPRLLELQKRSPGLCIRHRFGPTQDIIDAVLAARVEMGLVIECPDDPRLTVSEFATEPLELIVPAAAKVERWDDLMSLGFIDHPDGKALASRLLSRRFPGSPGYAHWPISGFTNQIGLILAPVAEGLGFTVLPRFARQAFEQQASLRVVTGQPEVADTLYLIHRAEWPLSSRAERALLVMGTAADAEAGRSAADGHA